MAYRNLELTLIGAHDLKNVNLFTPMQVYAAVSLTGDPRSRQRTPPDRHGGRNPNWSSTVRLNIPVSGDISRTSLHILLRTERTLGDRDVGEVFIPISDLLDGGSGPQFRSYQVRKIHSGKPKGTIDISFKLGEPIGTVAATHAPDVNLAVYPPPLPGKPANFATYPPPSQGKPADLSAYPPPLQGKPADLPAYPTPPQGKPAKSPKNDEPVLAYPVAGPSVAAQQYPPPGGYPQSAPAYGYGYQGQQGYGYGYQQPPPPAYGGYGYGGQVVQPQRKKKNNFGMGLGAGLLGGALGGLLIGDMVSDAASYDAGYDAGFGDGGFDGGFDF